MADKLKGVVSSSDTFASVVKGGGGGGGGGESESLKDTGNRVRFSSGNPRVAATRGVVHLYRDTSESPKSSNRLPEGRTEHLCVLAVPMHKTVADFCQFMGAFMASVHEMQIVRNDACAERYMVLIKFNSQKTADEFYLEYNGRAFSSMEPEVCHAVFVVDVEYTDSGENAATPPSGLTELPSCPVCLERLDHHISGILTTVCNHSFHSSCISKWADSSCPVCRYCQQQPERSTCTVCEASENLWICLICGFVGCGRYQQAHAIAHWRETQHCYSLETESQQVWDYVGDGYVHRLIQSKTDGKLVELPAPCDRGTDCGCESSHDREVDQAIYNSKIDSVEMEYSQLIADSLDAQRKHFDDLLRKAEDEKEAAIAAAVEKASSVKLQKQSQRITKLERENSFLRQVNESLITNQKQWQQKFKEQEEREQKAAKSRDEKIADLEDQVRDLMVFIEAQRTLQDAGNPEDIREGTVMAVPASANASSKPLRTKARKH
eukprot:TRINITY_DN901_c1_g2_i1.p1 TRINITY_DN901_c1_g2~~TRINITY_DN901_c1_g2_i1.p1  ORF type:complete len:528 (-),score=122.06 TRINITY_DN901_c1_g2_i1:33-1511(-)